MCTYLQQQVSWYRETAEREIRTVAEAGLQTTSYNAAEEAGKAWYAVPTLLPEGLMLILTGLDL